jgi:hypothetical protein
VRPTDVSAVEWIHGAADCNRSTDPPIQVVAYDEDTYVLRQSKCVNYEAPFMYLLFGGDAALLHDTGATADPGLFPIRRTVDEIIATRGPRRAGAADWTYRCHTAPDLTLRYPGRFRGAPDSPARGCRPFVAGSTFGPPTG